MWSYGSTKTWAIEAVRLAAVALFRWMPESRMGLESIAQAIADHGDRPSANRIRTDAQVIDAG